MGTETDIAKAIGDILGHPLLLLSVGALVTTYFIPKLLKKSEDRKKELEIKANLTAQMSEVIATALGHASTAVEIKTENMTKQDLETWHKTFLEPLTIKSFATRAQLSTYFPSLQDSWLSYFDALYGAVRVSQAFFDKNRSKKDQEHYIEGVKDFLKSHDVDWSEIQNSYDEDHWQNVLHSLFLKGDDLIAKVNKTKIVSY